VQVPLQRVVEPDARPDQPFAMVDEQPDVELRPGQLSGRQRPDALCQGRARDGQSIDAIGLAALAARAPGVGHQPRRDPNHPLAAGDQKPLEGPRHVPAVLQRPHPIRAESARPPQHGIEPASAHRGGLLIEHLARRRGDSGERVRALVHVRTEHDHQLRPFSSRLKWTAGGHGLLGAVPRSYQVTPEHPRPATSDTAKGGQAPTADSL
jgi:hypothetical protein